MPTACSPSAVTSSVLNTWSGSSRSTAAASDPKLRAAGSWSYSWIVKAMPAASSALTAGVTSTNPSRLGPHWTDAPRRRAVPASGRLPVPPPHPRALRRDRRHGHRPPQPVHPVLRGSPRRVPPPPRPPVHAVAREGCRRRRARGLRAVPPAAALRRRDRRAPAAGGRDPHDVPDGLPRDAWRRARCHGGDGARRGDVGRPSDPSAGLARRDGPVVTRWFTSDLHFGHANIIRYCARPYTDVEQMAHDLVARWNATVAPDDEVWVLGDVAMGRIEESLRLVGTLAGRKLLVPGNHDRCWPGRGHSAAAWAARYRDAGFAEVLPEQVDLTIGGQPAHACHFPYH